MAYKTWEGRLAADRNRYAANPEYRAKVAERARRYRQRLKIEVMSHYCKGPPRCLCCGDNHIEFLTLDHIDGKGSEHRKQMGRKDWGGVVLFRWLKSNDYPPNFRVLCFNCNIARSLFGVCPHERTK